MPVASYNKTEQKELEICTLYFQFFDAVFASKGYPLKNIFERPKMMHFIARL